MSPKVHSIKKKKKEKKKKARQAENSKGWSRQKLRPKKKRKENPTKWET